MKVKISGIPFDETTKVEFKKPDKAMQTMKALVMMGGEKSN